MSINTNITNIKSSIFGLTIFNIINPQSFAILLPFNNFKYIKYIIFNIIYLI